MTSKGYCRFEAQALRHLVWDDLVLEIAAVSELVAARVYDIEYDEWENNRSVFLAKQEGRLESNPKIVSNGLPFPLTEDELDISQNPGRWSLHKGYVEFIGETMWLGDKFFDVVPGVDRMRLAAAEFLDTEQLDQGLLKITCRSGPFVDRSTQSVQNALRSVLFGIGSPSQV